MFQVYEMRDGEATGHVYFFCCKAHAQQFVDEPGLGILTLSAPDETEEGAVSGTVCDFCGKLLAI